MKEKMGVCVLGDVARANEWASIGRIGCVGKRGGSAVGDVLG